MNLTVNSLPTKTWNHLRMNGSTVSLEGEFATCYPRSTPVPEGVLYESSAPAPELSGDLDPILGNIDNGYMETAEGLRMEKPLVLYFDADGGSRLARREILHARKGSTLQVVLQLTSRGGGNTLALELAASAEEGAKIEIYVAQLMDADSTCLFHLAGDCADGADITLTKLDLGAGKLYAGANVDLRGKDSTFNTGIGYHGKPGQLLDMNYVATHHGRNTTSLMEVSGTLEEGSRKIFRGTIDFRRGCAGAKGTENENVLLMGDEMVNQTIPLILCQEEDVEGNHGASIGQLDDKVLFYLGSRGMEPEDAKLLIARSRIEAICARFPAEDVRERVHLFEDQRGMFHGEKL